VWLASFIRLLKKLTHVFLLVNSGILAKYKVQPTYAEPALALRMIALGSIGKHATNRMSITLTATQDPYQKSLKNRIKTVDSRLGRNYA
jgi:hypothetical protein